MNNQVPSNENNTVEQKTKREWRAPQVSALDVRETAGGAPAKAFDGTKLRS